MADTEERDLVKTKRYNAMCIPCIPRSHGTLQLTYIALFKTFEFVSVRIHGLADLHPCVFQVISIEIDLVSRVPYAWPGSYLAYYCRRFTSRFH